MNGGPSAEVHSSLDALIADPGKTATLPPEMAQNLLIQLACLQPLLIQRALSGVRSGQEEELVLTVPEVANQLKLSSYRVYELTRQGTLKSVRLGKSVRVKPSAILEYLARQALDVKTIHDV